MKQVLVVASCCLLSAALLCGNLKWTKPATTVHHKQKRFHFSMPISRHSWLWVLAIPFPHKYDDTATLFAGVAILTVERVL